MHYNIVLSAICPFKQHFTIFEIYHAMMNCVSVRRLEYCLVIPKGWLSISIYVNHEMTVTNDCDQYLAT